ncbi:hypothetical protein [Sphingosinicella rhizophila]|uniref:Uncharacterized protein n=1 Tax=Sphingosinicella rhizophila TaxID=3050082 RepID=A0ABU3Q7B3_9SPHN|nr:hypothetical protein [Sphingosinicella sp. GR2756]MDT9599192.1 hypothetical protein [Sphingosinicella sp. GR2756]
MRSEAEGGPRRRLANLIVAAGISVAAAIVGTFVANAWAAAG